MHRPPTSKHKPFKYQCRINDFGQNPSETLRKARPNQCFLVEYYQHLAQTNATSRISKWSSPRSPQPVALQFRSFPGGCPSSPQIPIQVLVTVSIACGRGPRAANPACKNPFVAQDASNSTLDHGPGVLSDKGMRKANDATS